MKLPIYQVDAFTSTLFRGNPAAVIPLQEWLPDEQLTIIAAENNLSETAFFVPGKEDFELRWFTPTQEVDLCGHATLATAYIVFAHLRPDATLLDFRTASGRLRVERERDLLWMAFPEYPASPIDEVDKVGRALGSAPIQVLCTTLDNPRSDKIVAVYESAREIMELQPDMGLLSALGGQGAVVTAPGVEGIDFVSRYFAPNIGIPEDPVTGATHCTLAPYWADRFDKPRLQARQLSKRGGEIECVLDGSTVRLGGRAVQYLEGWIAV